MTTDLQSSPKNATFKSCVSFEEECSRTHESMMYESDIRHGRVNSRTHDSMMYESDIRIQKESPDSRH